MARWGPRYRPALVTPVPKEVPSPATLCRHSTYSVFHHSGGVLADDASSLANYSAIFPPGTVTYGQPPDKSLPCAGHAGVPFPPLPANPVQASSAHMQDLPYHCQVPTLYANPVVAPVSAYPTATTAVPRTGHPNTRTTATLGRADATGRVRVPPSVDDGSIVLVSGLPSSQSESQLRGLFKRYGTLVYLEIHPDSHNLSKGRGTARARYKTTSEALDAVRGLDGSYLANRKINVRQAQGGSVLQSVSAVPFEQESKRSTVEVTKATTTSSAPPAVQKKNHNNQKTKRTSSKTGRTGISSSTPPQSSSFSQRRQATAPTYDESERHSDRSSNGSTSPTSGPLVVNGATGSKRRPAHDESKSWRDNESSDDDETDDSESSDDGDDHYDRGGQHGRGKRAGKPTPYLRLGSCPSPRA